jgi:prophage endopeptidase
MFNLRFVMVLISGFGIFFLYTTVDHLRSESQRWKKEAERVTKISREQAAELDRYQALRNSLAALDQQHMEKLNEAEQENSTLRAELASGARRMRIIDTEAHSRGRSSPASCMGNDAPVELSAATGQRILSIRDGIIHDQQKIKYLQDYIRSACLQ